MEVVSNVSNVSNVNAQCEGITMRLSFENGPPPENCLVGWSENVSLFVVASSRASPSIDDHNSTLLYNSLLLETWSRGTHEDDAIAYETDGENRYTRAPRGDGYAESLQHASSLARRDA
jgi:hypothetical protein